MKTERQSVASSNGRPIIFGEVLFDRFPDGNDVLGGAPFNVAWHLQGFGCAPLFLSRVGDDEAGHSVRQAMHDWGLDVSGLQTDSRYPTGTVEIRMHGKQHTFEILPDQAYDHVDVEQNHAAVAPVEAALLYHGTLAMRSEKARGSVAELLSTRQMPVFVDVNLRDPWWCEADLPTVLRSARWAKVNDEELDIVARVMGLPDSTLEQTAQRCRAESALELLVVTRGEHGASAFDASPDAVEVAPTHEARIVDTVGAGDAFTSVVLLGLLRDWPLGATMQRAQDFASRICEERGATSASPRLYEDLLDGWDRGP